MKAKTTSVKTASKKSAVLRNADVPDKYGMTPAMYERLDNMTEEEIMANARSDPDNPPLEDRKRSGVGPRLVSIAKRIRWKLRLSQSEFAEAFNIPLGTLRDWEQYRRDPDQSAQAYLSVILHEPDAVRRALAEWAKTGVMGAIETTSS